MLSYHPVLQLLRVLCVTRGSSPCQETKWQRFMRSGRIKIPQIFCSVTLERIAEWCKTPKHGLFPASMKHSLMSI